MTLNQPLLLDGGTLKQLSHANEQESAFLKIFFLSGHLFCNLMMAAPQEMQIIFHRLDAPLI